MSQDALGPVVLDVVVGQRQPVDAGTREDAGEVGPAREAQTGRVEVPGLGRRHLVVGDGEIGLPEQAPHGTLTPGQDVPRHEVVAEDRVAADVPGDARGPAVEGEVHAPALAHDRVVDAAVGEGIAAGDQHPGACLVPAIAIDLRQRHRERPVVAVADAVVADQRDAVEPEGAQGRLESRGRHEPETTGAHDAPHLVEVASRHVRVDPDVERPRQGIGQAVEDDEAPKARQLACLEAANEVAAGEALPGRPEARHGHDGHDGHVCGGLGGAG